MSIRSGADQGTGATRSPVHVIEVAAKIDIARCRSSTVRAMGPGWGMNASCPFPSRPGGKSSLVSLPVVGL